MLELLILPRIQANVFQVLTYSCEQEAVSWIIVFLMNEENMKVRCVGSIEGNVSGMMCHNGYDMNLFIFFTDI